MKTDWFREARFGLFIHWGLYAIHGRAEWTRFHDAWDKETYEKYIDQFYPMDFKPAEWAELAWNAGMRYVVFTTKHHEGFCMFDSHYSEFKVTNSPYGKDITKYIVEAFRARGLKIGLYHSLVDWHHPDFIPDAEHPDWKQGLRDFTNCSLKNYQKYLYDSVEQLMTEYGKIDMLFFDYTSKYKTSAEWNPEPLLEMVYRHQPDILVNDRLSFDKKSFPGDYCTPEVCVPNQSQQLNGQEVPWETCMTLNDHWGYFHKDHNFKPLNTITGALMNCVSKNGNMLMNIGPDSRGNIPDEAITILKQLSEWFKTNSDAIHGASQEAHYQAPDGCFYSRKNGHVSKAQLTHSMSLGMK